MASNSTSTMFRRVAKEVKLFRVLTKIIASGVAAATTLLGLTFVVTLLYSNYGSFTVSVDKSSLLKYSISLCEDPTFNDPTSVLNCNAAEEITNIDGNTLPYDLDNINGAHSGANYLAYTFYCKNTGDYTIDYQYEIFITNITRDLDKAVRVKVYVDGDATVYARTASDGSGPEPGTTEFLSGNTIVKEVRTNLQPKSMAKFTVVVWIEGPDPDCIDDKIGGEFKLGMNIEIVGISEEEQQENV